MMPKKNASKPAYQFSLPIYIAAILVVALIISLVSLHLFWQSPTRKLSVEIQEAIQDDLNNPFFLPSDRQAINLDDQTLTQDDLSYIQQHIDESIAELDAQADFPLSDSEELLLFLEF